MAINPQLIAGDRVPEQIEGELFMLQRGGVGKAVVRRRIVVSQQGGRLEAAPHSSSRIAISKEGAPVAKISVAKKKNKRSPVVKAKKRGPVVVTKQRF